FGYLLASLLVRFTARTVNMLVLAVDVRDVMFSWHGALLSLATGTAVAAAAALFPALGAMRVTPLELLRHGLYRTQVSSRYGLACAAGALLTVLSGILIATLASRLPAPVVLVLCTVTFFALALCGPQMTIWIARWTRPLLRRWFHIEGYLAA